MISKKTIPDTMKALVLHGIADLKYEEVKVPELTKDCVLVNIKYCGICSSDIDRVFKNGTYHFPTIPGHEFSGEIVAVNDEDKELLGKQVSIFPLMPCMECPACQIGEYAQCSNYNYFGSRCDGAFSEYVVVPKWNLIYFDSMDYDVAALCEPAAVALHATRRIKLDNKEKVFVMGPGTIGLLIALFAKQNGCDVYVGSRTESNHEFIKSLGLKIIDTNNLEEEVNSKTNKEGFKYIFEAIGSNESIAACINAGGNFSQIVLVGNPHADLAIDQKTYWKVLRKQMTLTGTWNSNYNDVVNDWKDVLTFMKENYHVFKKLITNVYSLEEYNEAFDLLRDIEKYKIKVMFKI